MTNKTNYNKNRNGHPSNGANYNKRSGVAPNSKPNDTKASPVSEYNATTYSTTQINKSYNYFGINIFDYYSQEQLQALVRNPMANNDILREISLILYGMNGTYTNTVDYLCSLPTLDKVVIAHGRSEKKKAFNKTLMEETLRIIRDKEIIRDALFKGMVEGLAFYYFETVNRPNGLPKFMSDYDVESIVEINEDGLNACVLSLPTDYTRIVGTKNSSYVIAFNLDYFINADSERTESKLKRFPKEIRDAYYLRKNKGTLLASGNWVVLNNDHTIVHKIKSKRDEKYGRPIVIAAICDILYGDYFTETKRNVLDEINNRVVYQTFPEGREKGTSALTKKQQEDQHNAVKKAVLNKNNKGGTSFFSVAAGTKINALDTQNMDIFDEKNEANQNDKVALGLGIAGSLLNGVGSGTYAAQTNNLELASSQVFQWIDQITTELNKCISKCIIKDKRNWAECYYLPITYVNKSAMVGYMKDLYLQAGGSMSAYIAACGIRPDAYYALLDEEYANHIYDKYKPHQTSYTLSTKTVGRPTTDTPTENTVRSRTNNGNAIPSPSDN